MPPIQILTAERDVLRDQAREFAARLVMSGREVHFHEAAGMIHGFLSFRREIPEASDYLARALGVASSALAVDADTPVP